MNRALLSRFLLVVALLLNIAPAQAQVTPTVMKFSELYSKITVRGVEFSPRLKGLNGQQVEMRGYMAPPLKPKLDFFVLTRQPLASCPFCTSAADWPPDIVLVLMPDGKELDPSIRPLQINGRLEVGIKQDQETGFVSLVRLYAESVKEI